MTEKEEQDPVADAMMKAMFIVVMIAALAPVLQRMFAGAAAAGVAGVLEYRGIVDYREIRANSNISWIDLIHDPPYRPWVHAFIINDGPGTVDIGINHPNERFVMGRGETRTIDRTGADELIYSMFFICPIGETAALRITGEY